VALAKRIEAGLFAAERLEAMTEPELARPSSRSRIYRRVPLSPLTGPQLCELMGSFHPIYGGVDPELLLLVDDHFGHGNLRYWAAFTHSAAALCAEHGRDQLDEEIARNTFALHSGGIGA
jgi:hypothetical protein